MARLVRCLCSFTRVVPAGRSSVAGLRSDSEAGRGPRQWRGLDEQGPDEPTEFPPDGDRRDLGELAAADEAPVPAVQAVLGLQGLGADRLGLPLGPGSDRAGLVGR